VTICCGREEERDLRERRADLREKKEIRVGHAAGRVRPLVHEAESGRRELMVITVLGH
jgi:hypothetical protein